MRAHMRIHNGNNVTCDICRIRLSNEKALEAHRKKVHVHDYICKICNKVHKSRKALLNHMNVRKLSSLILHIYLIIQKYLPFRENVGKFETFRDFFPRWTISIFIKISKTSIQSL